MLVGNSGNPRYGLRTEVVKIGKVGRCIKFSRLKKRKNYFGSIRFKPLLPCFKCSITYYHKNIFIHLFTNYASSTFLYMLRPTKFLSLSSLIIPIFANCVDTTKNLEHFSHLSSSLVAINDEINVKLSYLNTQL